MTDAIRQTLGQLLADIPLKRTVKLRRIPMKAHGTCSLSDSEKTLTICIASNYPQQSQTDTLIHEFAHAMEYDQTGNHSKLWGKCHAQAYTAWTKRNV